MGASMNPHKKPVRLNTVQLVRLGDRFVTRYTTLALQRGDLVFTPSFGFWIVNWFSPTGPEQTPGYWEAEPITPKPYERIETEYGTVGHYPAGLAEFPSTCIWLKDSDEILFDRKMPTADAAEKLRILFTEQVFAKAEQNELPIGRPGKYQPSKLWTPTA